MEHEIEYGELLTPSKTAEILGVSEATLASWRMRKIGPKYIKMEGTIRYTDRHIKSYLVSREIGK